MSVSVTGYRRRVCLRVVNARLFYLILSGLRRRGVPYYVPKDPSDCCRADDIAVEELGREMGGSFTTRYVVPCNLGEEDLELLLERLCLSSAGLGGERHAAIGVDIGEGVYGIAIMVDYAVVRTELVTLDRLLDLVRIYRDLFGERLSVKLGVSPSNRSFAMTLAQTLSNVYGVRVELVDESHSTKEREPCGKSDVSEDELAACSILVREPFLVVKPPQGS